MRSPRTFLAAALLLALGCGVERPPLTVYNAAALGPPFRDALVAFADGVQPIGLQESAPSLDVLRKMTELGHNPDVLAVADRSLLPMLVVPAFADWYVEFGTNAMVLAYGPAARYADEISAENWWQVLLRPDVAVGRSDLRVDPSGYRADFSMQLAEAHYRVPGLADRLRAALPERNVRRAEADLSVLLQTGELDYGWTYESLAMAHGLRYLRLPREIDLSDPSLGDWYRQASVELPNPQGNPLLVRGEAIVFALTVPRSAPNHDQALAFVHFLLSARGGDVLQRSGFRPLSPPRFVGTAPSALRQ